MTGPRAPSKLRRVYDAATPFILLLGCPVTLAQYAFATDPLSRLVYGVGVVLVLLIETVFLAGWLAARRRVRGRPESGR